MLLSVKNLKIYFKHDDQTVKAVDGIDFTVKENEIVGLVGESGSGKTVTALSLMKLLPKRSCDVTGEIVCGEKIAIVFQEPFTSLNPVMRAGEQVDEGVLMNRLNGKSQTVQKTLALFKKVRLPDPERIYNSYPHQLSGGERQRVMLAMALSLKPKLLIADEPTTALDVTIQSEILDLILGLKEEFRMSVLFITHDFGIINKIAERVLVMKEGKIVETGEKMKILSSPENDYTKKLLSAAYGDRSRYPHRDNENCSRRAIMKIRNLNKTFYVEKGIFKTKGNVIHAVNNVSLDIKDGMTLGLVGESGSGKTTLGKLLIGLLKADSGTIAYGDRSHRRHGDDETCPHGDTQIVFQDPYSSLDPRMRMQDIILEGLTVKGVGKKEKNKILRELLFKVRLSYKDRLKFPHQFSGGERQRIAIARALAVNPRVLILDEPVSSLDVIIQSNILDLLKDLQKELALTYIFISHDLRVVGKLADDVSVMYKGEIVESGPSERIFKSPENPYTKRLVRSAV